MVFFIESSANSGDTVTKCLHSKFILAGVYSFMLANVQCLQGLSSFLGLSGLCGMMDGVQVKSFNCGQLLINPLIAEILITERDR